MLKILPLNNINFNAAGQNKTLPKLNEDLNSADKNPISKKGERLKLARSTFIAGLGFGLTMLAEIFDGGFSFEHIEKAGRKLAEKNYKNAARNKKEMMAVVSAFGLLAMFVGGCGFLYTLFKTPKILYEGKLNAYTKSKDMDVYIKGNNIEKQLLTQMNEKTKNADEAEKHKLKEQYMQLKTVKNQLPAFIKDEKKS